MIRPLNRFWQLRLPSHYYAGASLLLASIVMIALAPTPALAAFDEPVLLAERTIDLDRAPRDGLTTEFVELSGADNRFSVILLATVSGDLQVKGLRLTTDDGQTQELAVDRLVRARQPAVEVPLADNDLKLTRIEVLYRRPPSGAAPGSASSVLLQVSARPVEGAPPAAGQSAAKQPPAQQPKASPAVTAAERAAVARLVQLASRRIDLARPDIPLAIGPVMGAVASLQIRVREIPVIVRQIKVTFASGETRDIQVGQLIEADGASRIIDLGGGSRPQRIRDVVVQVRARSANETGTIELWGDPGPGDDRVAMAPPRAPEPLTGRRSDVERQELPPPVDPPLPRDVPRDGPRDLGEQAPRRADELGWKLLGSARDDDGSRSRTKRAVFQIRRVAGRITALRFLPRRDSVRLSQARVEFEDGSSERLDVRGYDLEPGQMTDVIPLRYGGRAVVRVEVVYRAMEAYTGPAVLEVWAKIDGGFGDRAGGRPDPDE